MNYEHHYHAGHYCDVMKHSILLILLSALQKKEKPLCYIDTHAGYADYDLRNPIALKTNEFSEGAAKIYALAHCDPPLNQYHALLKKINPSVLRHYPGSLSLAHAVARPQDQLIGIEQQRVIAESLKEHFYDDKQVSIHCRDAYEGLIALTPPLIKRGLVLIDPPYEQADEYTKIQETLTRAVQRWATACYCVWFPIKSDQRYLPLYEAVKKLPVETILSAEYYQHPNDVAQRLNGCGLLIIQPPWQVEIAIAAALDQLVATLGETGTSSRIVWLKR